MFIMSWISFSLIALVWHNYIYFLASNISCLVFFGLEISLVCYNFGNTFWCYYICWYFRFEEHNQCLSYKECIVIFFVYFIDLTNFNPCFLFMLFNYASEFICLLWIFPPFLIIFYFKLWTIKLSTFVYRRNEISTILLQEGWYSL